MRHLFWLYRPQVPTPRAQSIQVLSSAAAMAHRGHDVTVCVEPVEQVTASEILAWYGLQPAPTLRLMVLPASRTLASITFRGVFATWVARTKGQGIVVARSKRYASEALSWGKNFTLIWEVHEVDSIGQTGVAAQTSAALEGQLVEACDAVVANAPGTLALLLQTYDVQVPTRVLHNATQLDRARTQACGAEGAGYVGSLRDYKDVATLADAAAMGADITVITADDSSELVLRSQGRLKVEAPLAHAEVPDRLARFEVLLLPLDAGLFGRWLSSPIKLWDYLASGVPIVGADTESLHHAAHGRFTPYEPGDAASMMMAIDQAKTRPAVPWVRTWAARALELDQFVDDVCGSDDSVDVLYILRYWPTLTETFIYREIQELQRRGIHVAVLAIGEREDGRMQDELPNVQVFRPPSWVRELVTQGLGRRQKRTARARWTGRLAKSLGVRRLHAHFVGEPAAWAREAASVAGLSFSVTAHANGLFRATEDDISVLRAALPAIGVAKYHSQWMRERGVLAQTVRCGVPPMTAAPIAEADEIRFIAVGRNVPKKGLDILLKAFDGLAGCSLRLVSDHPGIPGVVSELLPPSQISAALLEADVFVLPCRVAVDGDRDGIPVAMMEAMAAGRPVVTCPTAGIPELVDESVGWLVPPDDVEALRATLRQVVVSRDQIRRRGAEARRRITEQGWTVERQVDELLEAWQWR
jgi:colanic acid/amylovoran biosynthesis glycosyltransferase